MRPKSSLPCSQGPSIKPYSETNKSSPHSIHPVSSRSIFTLSSHLPLGLSSSFIPRTYVTKLLHAFLMSPILLDSLTLIISGEDIKYEAFHYKLFFNLIFPILRPNILLSAVLKHPQFSSSPYKTTCEVLVFYILCSEKTRSEAHAF